MFIPYQYAYFFGVFYLAIIWLFLYWRMPQHRKTMLVFSFSLGWVGVVAEHVWFLKDWWHPQTITETRIGIEDFVASITHITIPAVLYKYIFGMDSKEIEMNIHTWKKFGQRFTPILLFSIIALYISTELFLLHSSEVFIACFALGSIWIGINRNDLIIPGFLSGILFVIVFFILYSLGGIFSPGVFEALWDTSVFEGVKIFGVPGEDYVFYFFWGWFAGVIYEYVFSLYFFKSNQDFEHDLRFIHMDFFADRVALCKKTERGIRGRFFRG